MGWVYIYDSDIWCEVLYGLTEGRVRKLPVATDTQGLSAWTFATDALRKYFNNIMLIRACKANNLTRVEECIAGAEVYFQDNVGESCVTHVSMGESCVSWMVALGVCMDRHHHAWVDFSTRGFLACPRPRFSAHFISLFISRHLSCDANNNVPTSPPSSSTWVI